MSQSLAQIYVHIVFGTKLRRTFIDANIAGELFAVIGGVIKKLGGVPRSVNGVPDHVHILATLPKTIALADFIRDLKHGSSVWIKNHGGDYRDFAWQSGYGAFSVSSSQIATVEKYIANQAARHQKMSLAEELAKLFARYHLDYDENYFWQ